MTSLPPPTRVVPCKTPGCLHAVSLGRHNPYCVSCEARKKAMKLKSEEELDSQKGPFPRPKTAQEARAMLDAHRLTRPCNAAMSSHEGRVWAEAKDWLQAELMLLETQERLQPRDVLLPPDVVAAKLAPKPPGPFDDCHAPIRAPGIATWSRLPDPAPSPPAATAPPLPATNPPEPATQEPAMTRGVAAPDPAAHLQELVNANAVLFAQLAPDPGDQRLRDRIVQKRSKAKAYARYHKLEDPAFPALPPLPGEAQPEPPTEQVTAPAPAVIDVDDLPPGPDEEAMCSAVASMEPEPPCGGQVHLDERPLEGMLRKRTEGLRQISVVAMEHGWRPAEDITLAGWLHKELETISGMRWRILQTESQLQDVTTSRDELFRNALELTRERDELLGKVRGLQEQLSRVQQAPPACTVTHDPVTYLRRARRSMWGILQAIEEMTPEQRQVVSQEVTMVHAQLEQAEQILGEEGAA